MKIEIINDDEINKILVRKLSYFSYNQNRNTSIKIPKESEIINQQIYNISQTKKSAETNKIPKICNYLSSYTKQNINYQKSNNIIISNKIFIVNPSKIVNLKYSSQISNNAKIELKYHILENYQITQKHKINNSNSTINDIKKIKFINNKNKDIFKNTQSNFYFCDNYEESYSFLKKHTEQINFHFTNQSEDLKISRLKDKYLPEWFHDVKFDNLPEDIFDDKYNSNN